jgi:hypothetical protein
LAADSPRLSRPPDAQYAVRGEAAWKRDVWLIASARPRQAMPPRCARASAPRWRTPITRVVARATVAPPVAATFSSSNATTAPLTIGRWPASSSAICASTTTSPSAISVPRATSHKRASCATCSIRPSTRFDPSRRRSRSAATRPPGWKSVGQFLGFIWKARNTADPIIGPSGVGTASAPDRPRSLQLRRRNNHARPDHPRLLRRPLGRRVTAHASRRMASALAQAALAQVALRRDKGPHLLAVPDLPNHARRQSRSEAIAPKGPTTRR